MKKILVMLLVLTVASLSVFAAQKYYGKEGKILIYLSGPAAMIEELESTFESEKGDVIDIFHTGCGPLREKIWTEKEAGNIRADVVWGSDPLIYYMLKKENILQKYYPKDYDSLKEEYKNVGEGYFTLVNTRYGVIVFNPTFTSKEGAPKSFADLENPVWKGLIGFPNPNNSATAFAMVAALWDMMDRSMDYFEKLKENKLFLTRKTSMVADKIAQGELDVGISTHDAVLRLNKAAKKQGFDSQQAISWPEEGALSIERPIAIIYNESRPALNIELAEAFVDFMISKEAQKITTKYGFVSVRNDIPIPSGIPENLKIKTTDWEEIQNYEEEIRAKFNEIMLND